MQFFASLEDLVNHGLDCEATAQKNRAIPARQA